MRRIHILIFSIVTTALVLLTIVLGTLHILHERDVLENATYQQGQIAVSSFREASTAIQGVLASVQEIPGVQENLTQAQTYLLMLRQADQNLYAFVENNQNIRFATLLSENGSVFLHSNPALMGKRADEIGLQNVPIDGVSRRHVAEYGDVYVTRINMTVGEAFDVEYDIIVGMPTEPVDDAARESILTTLLAALGVLLLMAVAAFLLVHFEVVLPLHTLTTDILRMGTGQLDRPVSVRGTHEIRTLGHTINRQAQQWQQARRELETLYHSAETRLVNRARDIEISAQIMRIATSLRDVDTLLIETVNQIRDRFDVIYHAQVFLLDDVQEFAVVVASTGAAGQQLLQLGHKLAVGSDSLIGRVTSAATTVIASDTRRGEVPWQPNPILPSTRSEMAVPLMIQGRVIGALDVQSIAPDVFTEDIMRTFEVLADQLAIAIENARLLAETQQRLTQINTLNRQMTQATWDEFVTDDRRQKPQGYSYDLAQVSPLEADIPSPTGEPVAEVPIRVHGETVGTLTTVLPASGRLTSDDRLLVEAVADRVALAIENARLFEQTQRALTETERLYETARTVSSASDLDAIYQLVVDQLSTSARADHIAILRSGPDPMLVQYLDEVFHWSQLQTVDDTSAAARISVPPLTYTDADPLPILTPAAYSDTSRDLPDDHPLAAWLDEQGLRSAVLAPITAGGRWFGLLIIGTQDPGGFDGAYVSFAGAMADQLALAIENRRLFEEAQTEARRARALAEAGQLASQIGVDLEAGLRSLFRAVSGPGNYDRWWFGLLADDHTTLQQVVGEGIASAETVNLEHDDNALAEAARIGQIVLVNDPHDHPLTAGQPPDRAAAWGKHIAMPVRIGDAIVGVLLIGRGLDEPNLDERDIQLAATLASQIAVATQNQNLFTEAESQRQRLQIIVDSMPTGILVMDRSGKVLLSNQNLMSLLGPEMRPGTPERPRPYPIIQADTREDYPRNQWPLSRVFETGEPASVDDMTIIQPDSTEINVLAQAAPIYDAQGNVIAVVGAFQDITDLQELERALQDSLRETTLLYEASRSISRATTLEELLKAALWHMNTLRPDQAFIFLAGEGDNQPRGRLAAAQPEIDFSDCHDTLFDGMFGDEPVMITRDTAPPATVSCLDTLGLEALSSFPLSVRGQISGWIMIGFHTAQIITTEQRRFMTTMADQAAVTIENQRLLLQTADALEETATLYHASRAVSDAENPADLLNAFVQQASTHPVAFAALYTLLGESAETSYAAVELLAQYSPRNTNVIGTRYRADQFALWDAMHRDEVLLISDLTADTTLTDTAREQFVALGLKSTLVIPLRAGDRVVGVLVLGREEQWAQDDAEIRVYETLADQAAVALENTRLLIQSQRRARQLGTSAQISRAVTSILHLDELLPQVVNQIRDAFEYDHVQVFLISEDGEHAELVASTGEAGQKLLELKHSLPVGSHSVIGQVTATGDPQIALDTADARVVHRPNPILPHTRSEMALPLIARGQIVGALDVQSNMSGAFTDEDASILAALADMVATAIDNARLFEVAEQRAEEMAFLFSITTAAATSPDLDEALQQVVHTLRATMNINRASVYLPDESGETLVRGAHVGSRDIDTDDSAADIDRGLIGWVAQHKEPVVIGDIEEDPRRLTDTAQNGSVIAVPLVTGSELVGVLLVTSDELYAFDEEDMRLLQTLSSSLAAIIQNRRLLREMQEVNEQLLEVDRLKTNFLAAMSHELRTPLNSIIGFSRLLVKGMGGPLTDPQREDLTTIYESGKHLLGLVNDILDQAKLEAGKMELSYGVFKVQDVVKGVMSSAVGLTRDKGLALHTEIAQDVPDAYGDEFRTRQVLLNLVSNAAKFTDEGSITVTVQPILEHGETFIQVSVTDTGIGIAEEDMHKLFEAFQQVDSSLTRKVGGTGMGLPLAKSFTELQGGRIWVDSKVGKGSTFHITIPTQPQSDEAGVIDDDPEVAHTQAVIEPPQTPQAAPTPSNLTPNLDMASDGMPPTDTPPKTALIVEDNEGVMDLYRRCLEPLGYTVIGVTDPGSVRYTLAARPDVIVIDVHMRDGAGWGVLEDLVHRTTLPIVVCSIDPDRERGLALGAVEYIFKPFSEDQLANAVLRVEAVAQRQRILLVDDHPETVRVFREALEATQRYRVFQVTSGEAALTLIQEPPHVDLVILDLRMPELDGFEVLQAMRADARTASIPVLVLTADEVNDTERAALQSIDTYRKDDIDEERLLHRVQAQLNPNGEND